MRLGCACEPGIYAGHSCSGCVIREPIRINIVLQPELGRRVEEDDQLRCAGQCVDRLSLYGSSQLSCVVRECWTYDIAINGVHIFSALWCLNRKQNADLHRYIGY